MGCVGLALSKENKINTSELVRFLQSNVHITQLSLKRCDISEEGAEALANVNLLNLTSLSLNGNNIGEQGAKALANGNLLHLTSLSLNGNKISCQGAWALVSDNLPNLTLLSLGGNKISGKDAEIVTHALGDRQGMTPLHWAVKNGDTGKMNDLIKGKTDIDAIDKQGWTPLH